MQIDALLTDLRDFELFDLELQDDHTIQKHEK